MNTFWIRTLVLLGPQYFNLCSIGYFHITFHLRIFSWSCQGSNLGPSKFKRMSFASNTGDGPSMNISNFWDSCTITVAQHSHCAIHHNKAFSSPLVPRNCILFHFYTTGHKSELPEQRGAVLVTLPNPGSDGCLVVSLLNYLYDSDSHERSFNPSIFSHS